MSESSTDPERADPSSPVERRAATLSRIMRRLTGVPEELLNDAPSERPRYTGMAWAMLGTAALATIGMAVLVRQISDLPWVIIGVVAVGWGLFILGIDYSIVSYVDEKKGLAAARQVVDHTVNVPSAFRSGGLARLLTRLLLALVLGVAIGESLVIAAFKTQADTYLTDRQVEKKQIELCKVDGQLKGLRPATTVQDDCPELLGREAATDGSGRGATTTTAAPTTTTTSPGGTIVASTADLNARLKELDLSITKYTDLAQCERYPASFNDEQKAKLNCSGKAGNGEAARAADVKAAEYRTEKDGVLGQIKTLQDAAIAANQTETEANGEAGKTEAENRKDEDAAERKKARELYNSPEAVALAASKTQLTNDIKALNDGSADEQYGLSERFDATEKAVNPWIRWGLRLLFVIVDMTPVLIKLTLGTSAVDQMVSIRRRMSIYPYLQELKAVETAYISGQNVRGVMPSVVEAPGRSFGRKLFGIIGDLGRRGADRIEAARQAPQSAPKVEEASGPDLGSTEPMSDNPPPQPRSDGWPAAVKSKPRDNLVAIGNRSFILDRPIGEGNFATVWFARPASPQSFEEDYPIVVKVPSAASASGRALKREYEFYEKFSTHALFPSMVCGSKDGIVLRYYPRTSLDRWLFADGSENQGFSYEQVVGWLHQIIRSVGHMWEQGWVHGDGKPANIVVTGSTAAMGAGPDEPDRVRLIDFGTTVANGDPISTLSPGYSPPEALTRGKDYTATPLVDIYSYLGAVLYYLVSGGVDPWADQVRDELPKAGATRAATPRQRRSYAKAQVRASRDHPITPLVSLNPDVPPGLAQLVSSWMSADVEERLALPGSAPEKWKVGLSWQIDAIVRRLDQQLEWLQHGLITHFGQTQFEARLLGIRHPLAVDPAEVPDFTLDRQDLFDDLDGEGGVR